MKTMIISVYYAEEGFVAENYLVPSFVVNDEAFREGVQALHIATTKKSLVEREKSTGQALSNCKPEKRAERQKAHSEAVKALEAFKLECSDHFGDDFYDNISDTSDTVESTYAMAFGLHRWAKFGESINKLAEDLQWFSDNYLVALMAEAWTDEVKETYAGLKNRVNRHMNGRFSLLEQEEGKYKTIRELKIDNEQFKALVASCNTKVKNGKVNLGTKEDPDVLHGVKSTKTTGKTVANMIYLYFFYRYGCALPEKKKVKKADTREVF